MADPKEIFPILDNDSGEGTSPIARVEGDTPVAKNGLIGFSFKDASGNVVLPQLDAQGRVVVTSDSSGIFRKAFANISAGSLSYVDVASLTLATSKTFIKCAATFSCIRESLFKVVHTDDAVVTILAEIVVGPGQYTFTWNHPEMEVSSGATGTQSLKIQGMNLDKLAALRGDISCVEVDS